MPLLIRTLLLSSVVYFALDVVRRSGDVSAPVREGFDELLSLGGMAGSSFDARGKTVLVTGASSGIGEALAYKYAALRAHVGLVAHHAATLEQGIGTRGPDRHPERRRRHRRWLGVGEDPRGANNGWGVRSSCARRWHLHGIPLS